MGSGYCSPSDPDFDVECFFLEKCYHSYWRLKDLSEFSTNFDHYMVDRDTLITRDKNRGKGDEMNFELE